jgi:hypothetical protein
MYPLELLFAGPLDRGLAEPDPPFLVAVPGFVFTLWILFDRKTPWVRIAFILTMWASVLTGVLGAYFPPGLEHGRGDINWKF